MTFRYRRAAACALLLCTAGPIGAQTTAPSTDARATDRRAAETERRMLPDERTVLTHGLWAIPLIPNVTIPAEAVLGAGYVTGIPRLNVPALIETDASLGVSYIAGLRKDGATALPSATAMGSTWNPDLIRRGGAMIAREARAKGFNVLLGGGINLMRDPRNGRTFEYFGEDPLHAGVLGGAAIDGENNYGPAKLRLVERWLEAEGIARADARIRFYSDHVSDAPVLEWADEPFVVNPSGPLRRLAKKSAWPILDWGL